PAVLTEGRGGGRADARCGRSREWEVARRARLRRQWPALGPPPPDGGHPVYIRRPSDIAGTATLSPTSAQRVHGRRAFTAMRAGGAQACRPTPAEKGLSHPSSPFGGEERGEGR